MKHILLSLALLLPTQFAQAAEAPGFIQREVDAPHHKRSMQMSIWYQGEGGVETSFGENPVFQGVKVRENIQPSSGKHPVVLLSHGLGGNQRNLGWLAAGLVERGAIVIAVNHPNSSFPDMDNILAMNHWTRVNDLQTALDAVMTDANFAPLVDPSRIYAAGFSYGGWTALSMAGVTGKLEASAAYCKAAGDRSTHCFDLKKAGVDLTKMDAAQWSASYKDNRIKAVAAIDAGLTWGLTAADVKDVDQDKVLLIGLGTGKDRLFATDTSENGNNFNKAVPDAHIELVHPANHFTAMPLCKPEGPQLLAADNDEAVCSDPEGAVRSQVHDKMVEMIAKHFDLAK